MFLTQKLFVSPLAKRAFSTASPLVFASTVHPQKDAIRFENQNRLWTYKEIEVFIIYIKIINNNGTQLIFCQ